MAELVLHQWTGTDGNDLRVVEGSPHKRFQLKNLVGDWVDITDASFNGEIADELARLAAPPPKGKK